MRPETIHFVDHWGLGIGEGYASAFRERVTYISMLLPVEKLKPVTLHNSSYLISLTQIFR